MAGRRASLLFGVPLVALDPQCGWVDGVPAGYGFGQMKTGASGAGGHPGGDVDEFAAGLVRRDGVQEFGVHGGEDAWCRRVSNSVGCPSVAFGFGSGVRRTTRRPVICSAYAEEKADLPHCARPRGRV